MPIEVVMKDNIFQIEGTPYTKANNLEKGNLNLKVFSYKNELYIFGSKCKKLSEVLYEMCIDNHG